MILDGLWDDEAIEEKALAKIGFGLERLYCYS